MILNSSGILALHSSVLIVVNMWGASEEVAEAVTQTIAERLLQGVPVRYRTQVMSTLAWRAPLDTLGNLPVVNSHLPRTAASSSRETALAVSNTDE